MESSLTIDESFGRLREIKEVSGKGSQEEKTRLLSIFYSVPTLKKGNISSGFFSVNSGLDSGTSFCSKHFLLLLQETKNMQEGSRKVTTSAQILENLQNPLQNTARVALRNFSIRKAHLELSSVQFLMKMNSVLRPLQK